VRTISSQGFVTQAAEYDGVVRGDGGGLLFDASVICRHAGMFEISSLDHRGL
jgi:hypothetical protein